MLFAETLSPGFRATAFVEEYVSTDFLATSQSVFFMVFRVWRGTRSSLEHAIAFCWKYNIDAT